MINYESMIIEANTGWTDKVGAHVPGLIEQGKEPLCAVYPKDGMMISDSPLAYVDKGDTIKETLFLSLQQHLLSADVQNKMKATGRRTGILGLDVGEVDTHVWNPNWGIKSAVSIASVPVPTEKVLAQMLDLYQTVLRKPSLTVWVLDVSQSMSGTGITQLREAMGTLFDAETAKRNLLQIGPHDVNIIIQFDGDIVDVWKLVGNDPA
jgi:Ca-activated chloride channel family protein